MSCDDDKSIKMLPISLPKQLSNQHPNLHRCWSQLGSILGGFGEPSWSQVGTKSLQKSIQKAIQKMITFWIAPRSSFRGFWPELAPQEGGENVLFFLYIFASSPLGAILGPRSPKTSQRGLLGAIEDDFNPQLCGFWDVFGALLA